MGLENSTTISGLNASWPLGTDPKSEGDNHIRLIKAVLQADAYRPDNVLDPVAQAAGVPTGGIVSRVTTGAGAGVSVRFADGTQICFLNPSNTDGITAAAGALFMSPVDYVWTFQQPFSVTPSVAGSLGSVNRIGGVTGFGSVATPNDFTYRLWSATTLAAPTGVSARIIAVGRWF